MLHFTPIKRSPLVIAVGLMTLFFCLPNVLPESILTAGPSWWRPMQLGLDLRGGSYLLLEVDTTAIVKEQLTDLQETIRSGLREAKIRYRDLRVADGAVFVTRERSRRHVAPPARRS